MEPTLVSAVIQQGWSLAVRHAGGFPAYFRGPYWTQSCQWSRLGLGLNVSEAFAGLGACRWSSERPMLVICRTSLKYIPLNLGRLQQLVEQQKLDVGQRVLTMRDLLDVGAVNKQSAQNLSPGIKLLASVSFSLHFDLLDPMPPPPPFDACPGCLNQQAVSCER